MLLVFLILLSACFNKKSTLRFQAPQFEKRLVLQDGHAEFSVWEFEDQAILWTYTLGAVPHIDEYRDSLALVLGQEGLEKAIAVEADQSRDLALLEEEQNGADRNADLVHTGTVGHIRPINYLEAFILNYQLGRFPLLGHPTEFHGFIAKHPGKNLVRVYFAASDAPWPPKPRPVMDAMEDDLERGWKLVYHLHNHYCEEDKDYIGILAPSMPDAQYFKMLANRYDLQKALITNAYHTVEIEAKHFSRFDSH